MDADDYESSELPLPPHLTSWNLLDKIQGQKKTKNGLDIACQEARTLPKSSESCSFKDFCVQNVFSSNGGR